MPGEGASECSQCVLESRGSPDSSSRDASLEVTSACACDSDTPSHICDSADTESSYTQSPLHSINSSSSVTGGGGAARQLPYCTVKTSSSDLGYSSGPDGCDSCSASSNSADGAGSMLDVTHCDRHTPGQQRSIFMLSY